MDALALLCNLHADGPFTLQRLRRSGCHSLDSLLELPAIQLSTHLDGSARTAERFLREAHLLAERLEDQDRWEVDESGGSRTPEPAEVSLDEAGVEDELVGDEPAEEEEYVEAYGYGESEDEDEIEHGAAEDELKEELEELDELEEHVEHVTFQGQGIRMKLDLRKKESSKDPQ